MRQSTLIVFGLSMLFSFAEYLNAQCSLSIKAEALTPVDTLSEEQLIANFDIPNYIYQNKKYFMYYSIYKNTPSNYLFIKEKQGFIIYLIYGNERQRDIKVNDKYLLIEDYYSHGARQILSAGIDAHLIDLENKIYFTLPIENSVETWTYDSLENSAAIKKWCSTKLVFEDKGFTALTFNQLYDSRDCLCLESGKYRIMNEVIHKNAEYLEETFKFKPIIWVQDFYIGMPVEQFKSKHSNFVLKEVPCYVYGIDSEAMGLEVIVEGQLTFFLTVYQKKITSIFILNQIIQHEEMDLSLTAQEILDQNQNASVRIDLLSHWEYIYIKEKNMKFIFKTNSANRIADYINGLDEPSQLIIKPNVKADFIQVRELY